MDSCVSEGFFYEFTRKDFDLFRIEEKIVRIAESRVFFVHRDHEKLKPVTRCNHCRMDLFQKILFEIEDCDEALCNLSISNSLIIRYNSSTTRNISNYRNIIFHHEDEIE